MMVIVNSRITGRVVDFIEGSEDACEMFQEFIEDKYQEKEVKLVIFK